MLTNIGFGGVLLIAIVVLVLFGRGKISGLLGEIGTGISAFRKGLKADDKPAALPDQSQRVDPALNEKDR